MTPAERAAAALVAASDLSGMRVAVLVGPNHLPRDGRRKLPKGARFRGDELQRRLFAGLADGTLGVAAARESVATTGETDRVFVVCATVAEVQAGVAGLFAAGCNCHAGLGVNPGGLAVGIFWSERRRSHHSRSR